ncbi:MAG: restriction endonuclease [Muribaculaceae bacterium]|nr:restriction endonuclease [Muribaculaceae bacterium]
MEHHSFTPKILNIVNSYFHNNANAIIENSLLLQYINKKTKSAERGSKSRSSFANLYAIYVLIEDYISNNYLNSDNYSEYEGALFSNLLKRMRELPFGAKLQNHALNHRMNQEFQRFFPDCTLVPIVRDLQTNRYWINENLLKVTVDGRIFNIANSIIDIIDEYAKVKTESFKHFINQCEELETINKNDKDRIRSFVLGLLAPNVDARLFEIVSYAILKNYYKEFKIYWGFSPNKLNEDILKLYKTGRTNANDGGIDFVMKPLGRFFQVTETLDFKKYFLDIEKIERYPITFVVKTKENIEVLRKKLHADAISTYSIESVVSKYMDCIEELINIPRLTEMYGIIEKRGELSEILNEIILQSRVEFNFDEEDNDEYELL